MIFMTVSAIYIDSVKADLQYLALRPEVNVNVRQTQE